MIVDGHRLRTASRITAVGLALLAIRAAIACGGSAADTESDSCEQRHGHCVTTGAVQECDRGQTAFVDTCFCCVPDEYATVGDDDSSAPPPSVDAAATDSAPAEGGNDAAPSEAGVTDAGDASDGAG